MNNEELSSYLIKLSSELMSTAGELLNVDMSINSTTTSNMKRKPQVIIELDGGKGAHSSKVPRGSTLPNHRINNVESDYEGFPDSISTVTQVC